MKLKAIGFWYSEDEKQFINPKDCVGNYSSEEEKDNLINYLIHGSYIVDYMGYSYCRFGCKNTSSMGTSEQTDGVWVWPEGLKHYVKEHNVVLPKEFIQHAQDNNWIIQEVSNKLSLEYNYDLCRNT